MISAVAMAVQALLDDAGVAALVATRIAPDPLPQTTTLPALSISLVDEVEERLLGGMSGYPLAVVHVSCLAATMTAALSLGETVKAAFANLQFAHGGKTADFRKQGPDFTDWSEDQKIFRRVIGFEIRWR